MSDKTDSDVLVLDFNSVSAENWRGVVREAENFVLKIQKAYDKTIVYVLCKYLQGTRVRTLCYFYLDKLPPKLLPKLLSFFYFIERNSDSIKVNISLESIFLKEVIRGRFKVKADPVSDTQISELEEIFCNLDMTAFHNNFKQHPFFLLNSISDHGTVSGIIKYVSIYSKKQEEKSM